MLKLITTLTFFLFGMLAKGQVSETRTVADFTKMEVKNATVVYTEGNESSLKIESEYNDAPETVITEVTNGILRITGKNAGLKTIVYVTGKQVGDFKVSAKAKVTVTNEVSAKNTTVTLRSGGIFIGNLKAEDQARIYGNRGTFFKGQVQVETLIADFNSNAQAILCGSAAKAVINTESKAVCNARNFTTDTLRIRADGESNVTIYARKLLAINVLDSARVIYNGKPQSVEINENARSFNRTKSDKLVSYNY